MSYPGFGALFLIWTAVGALTAARHYFLTPPRFAPMDAVGFVASIGCFAPGVLLSPVAFRLERRFPLGAGGWPRHLAILAALSLPISLLVAPLMVATFLAPLYLFGAPKWSFPIGAIVLLDLPVAETMFWCSVAGGYIIRTRFQLREQERRAAGLALERAQLEAGLRQAQLEVLRARLNPHFLFNSLQNISVMTREDPQVASSMLARLGDLLRAVLRQDSGPETTLDEEVALTRSYVALEQMRFGDRLTVTFEIADEVRQALLPCFLLQPLVENAIVHGLRGAKRTGSIVVAAASDAAQLVLTIRDNGVGLPQQANGDIKVGVGLGSTCERLEKMYPGRQTFSIRTPPDGGTEVRIDLPLHFATDAAFSHDDECPAIAGR